jgi:serine/threonine protein kinase/Tol biopolymer transport system component
MIIEAGTRVGKYEVQELLGAGGMGEVYRAFDVELRRPVALKFIPADIATDPRRMARFEQEALAASALNHPHILTVYDIATAPDGRRFFATELVDGLTLREHLKTRRPRLGEVLDIAAQIASALVEAHAHGIVHRDIKPDNVMVRRRDGYVKVLDFGLAKMTGAPTGGVDTEADTRALVMTDAGAVMGTTSYMSPEQAAGDDVDHRTDIWSLGVVLYEMLTGELPFKGRSASHTIVSILDDEPPPLSAYFADAPEALQEVVSDALTKDRDARFQTAKQMLAKLQRLKRRLDAGISLDHTISPENSQTSGEVSGRALAAPSTASGTHRTASLRSAETTQPTDPGSAPPVTGAHAPSRRRWMVPIVALCVVVLLSAAGFAGYRYWKGRAGAVEPYAPLASMKFTKLPAPGQSGAAVISPDGKYIARIVEEAGKTSVRLRQVASGGGERELFASADHYVIGVTFSPDGEFLYYVLGRRGQSFRDLYRVGLLGGEPQRLIADVDSAVTLSPDGRRVVFRRHIPKTREDTLVLASLDGGEDQTLLSKSAPEEIIAPAWSPDGRVVAYAVSGRDPEGYYINIEAVRVADRVVESVSRARWRAMSTLAWLPGGEGLVFSGRDRGSLPSTPMQVWFVPYPGAEARRITNDLNNYGSVSLSSDARTLLALVTNISAQLWVAPEGDAARARQITSGGANALSGISWMADGRIIYESDASGNHDIWMVNADGTGARQLTFDPNTDSAPAASPDGRYVVFYSNRGVGWGIWRINVDGGDPKELVRNIDMSQSLQWSPDSGRVYYVSRGASGNGALWAVSVDGSEPVMVAGERIGHARISPDGRSYYTTWQDGTGPDAVPKLLVAPVEGGAPPREVVVSNKDVTFAGHWSPDGQAVDYVITREGVGNIWRLPLAGANPRPRQLTDWKNLFLYRFAWSADGRQLAVSRGAPTVEMVLINGFR